ncbi:MAG: hypothetical protein AB1485_03275 [Candidatus Thermoplasmatota archaeon]
MRFSASFRVLKALKPLLISHHPNCYRFEAHVVKVGNTRICLSCFVTYSTILLTLSVCCLMGCSQIFVWHMLLCAGLALSPVKLLSGRFSKKIVKVMLNLIFGLGVSFIVLGILAIPTSLVIKILAFVVLILALGAFSYIRVNKIILTCNECEYRRNWSSCPGFKELYAKVFKATIS